MSEPTRITVAQYHQMIHAGILASGDPIELLEGVLVQKKRKTPPHTGSTLRADTLLNPLTPAGYFYTYVGAITLSDGEPEPDGMIVRGNIDDYWKRHPGPVDVALVIEVSDSTLDRDRTVKLRSYARAGIPVYWIVNLIDRQIEVHTDPDPMATPEPTYRRRDIYAGDAAVPVPVVGTTVPAAALLPPIG